MINNKLYLDDGVDLSDFKNLNSEKFITLAYMAPLPKAKALS